MLGRWLVVGKGEEGAEGGGGRLEVDPGVEEVEAGAGGEVEPEGRGAGGGGGERGEERRGESPREAVDGEKKWLGGILEADEQLMRGYRL